MWQAIPIKRTCRRVLVQRRMFLDDTISNVMKRTYSNHVRLILIAKICSEERNGNSNSKLEIILKYKRVFIVSANSLDF